MGTSLMAEAAARSDIAALAERWSCPAGSEQVGKVWEFFRLLLEWNARVNLTGAKRMEELIQEHLPDSLALSRLTPASANVVEVGAGGGLPGVPFAVLRPDCRTTLVEPRAKRTAFLGAAVRLLGQPEAFRVVRGRDSDLVAGSYDVAASRATFLPSDWLGAAGRLLALGGRAVAFASSPLGRDVAGLALVDAVSYTTGRGAPRWAAAYVPRGTTAAAG
jgi:16S rRNA (guanine(527)-N(7))-methyltransferase RsmG